jgi:Lon protease-like protein
VSDALDGAGQIAMAIFDGDRWKTEYEGRPPVRPAVCVGHIVQHQAIPDGRYLIRLHGVCRAKIIGELPAAVDIPYRRAMLEPVGLEAVDESLLADVRGRLIDLLSEEPLTDLRHAEGVVKFLRDHKRATAAILEIITCAMLSDSDMRFYNELHYRLLAEGDVCKRAAMIEQGLLELAGLLRRARPQRLVETIKGCSWN